MPDPRPGEIEAYLSQLKLELGNLPEREEIGAELRSHLHERLSREPYLSAQELLRDLDTPRLLARSFLEQTALPQTVRKPGFPLARTLLYGLVLLSLATAVLKLLFPQRVGVWLDPNSLAVFLLSPRTLEGHDFLGYWLVPLNLAVGMGLYWLMQRGALR